MVEDAVEDAVQQGDGNKDDDVHGDRGEGMHHEDDVVVNAAGAQEGVQGGVQGSVQGWVQEGVQGVEEKGHLESTSEDNHVDNNGGINNASINTASNGGGADRHYTEGVENNPLKQVDAYMQQFRHMQVLCCHMHPELC